MTQSLISNLRKARRCVATRRAFLFYDVEIYLTTFSARYLPGQEYWRLALEYYYLPEER